MLNSLLVYICTHECYSLYTHVRTHRHTHTYTCTQIYTHVYTILYTHIHTYVTHIRTQTRHRVKAGPFLKYLISYIIDNDDSIGTPVVTGCDGLESLLSCCVPLWGIK